MVAPMLGAAFFPLIGMRGVFGITSVVYVVLALVALYVLRKNASSVTVGAVSRAAGD